MGWIVLTVILAICVLILAGYLWSLRSSIREVAEELEEKLELDTNTLLSISSGDRAVRMLAARIDAQLRGLRKERLRLQNGDAELKLPLRISHMICVHR